MAAEVFLSDFSGSNRLQVGFVGGLLYQNEPKDPCRFSLKWDAGHRALSRPARSEGGVAVAGSDPRRRSPAHRRSRHRESQDPDPRFRTEDLGAGLNRLGLGFDFPR